MARQFEDLDYDDDTALISSTWAQAQTKLEIEGKQWGDSPKDQL